MVQTGLPAGTEFEVSAINGADGRILRESEARSDAAGNLSVRLTVSLRGITRLHAEVEQVGRAEAEYGEADVDLDASCHVTGQAPVGVVPSTTTAGASTTPPPPTTPAATDAPSDDASSGSGVLPWLPVGVAAAVTAGVLAAVVARRRQRRPGGDDA